MAAARRAAAPASASYSSGQLHTLLCLALHVACLGCYAAVIRWHFSPAAVTLPGYTGFGRFFRYLTFCGFTAQLLLWPFAIAADLVKLLHRSDPAARRLTQLVDDWACALVPLASSVTVLFYALLTANPTLVVESALRPEWLSPVMHVGNSFAAWGDALLVRERTFSARAGAGAAAVTSGYAVWIQVVRQVTGQYPYPVLNLLPHPQGYVALSCVGHALAGAVFMGGRALARMLLGRRAAVTATQAAPVRRARSKAA